LPTLSQQPSPPPKPQVQHKKPRGTKRASTEKEKPQKRRRKNDSEREDSAPEEEAREEKSTTKSNVKQQRRKSVDSYAKDLASEAKDNSAESESGDNVHGGEMTSAKRKGNGTTESNPERDSPEVHSENDEEEDDVKPTKSRRNDARSRERREISIGRRLSSEEKGPRKPPAKAKAMKQNSFTSVSPTPTEEEDTTSIVKARVSPSDDLEEDPQTESELSEVIDKPAKLKQSRKSKAAKPKAEKTKPKSANPKEPSNQSADPDPTKAEQSDSSMSVLIDEPPKPKRNRKPDSAPAKAHSTKSTKSKKPTEPPSDPDSEEIKRLQSQLVKCGIRKMWFKELSPFPTPKSKIKHLKQMLADAGMTGRFSEAKAEQIREERELRADLEAVQEGEKKWGRVGEEDGGGVGRGKRALAKGFEGLGFLNDDDGEETD